MLRLLLSFIIIPFTLFGGVSWHGESGDQFKVDVTLSDARINIDDNLIVSLLLYYPEESFTVDWDRLRMNLLKYAGVSEPPFALISEQLERLPDGGTKAVFTLEPLLEGVHFISLYDISFIPKDPEKNDAITIVSDIFQVETYLEPLQEPFYGFIYPLLSLSQRYPITISATNRQRLEEDIKAAEMQNMSTLKSKTLPWPEIGGGVLFLVILLIARMQPITEKKEDRQKRRIAFTAKRKAIRSLADLELEKLPEKEAFDAYYTRLTNTVRTYIEEKFQIKATTDTTSEFLEEMKFHPGFDKESRDLMRGFLISSDKVKFARYKPTPEDCLEAGKMAKKFIRRE